MENIIIRLKEFISKTGLSPRAFALLCGLKQNTLSRQLNGSNEISFATILAIANQYPELSLEWLIRGIGNMYLPDNTEVGDAASPTIQKVTNIIQTLTQVVNEQEEEIEGLRKELKNKK